MNFKIPVLFLVLLTCFSLKAQKDTSFADKWEFVGIAVDEPGYCVWGTSPILGEDGRTHLFVARWPGNTVVPGWKTHSEIAHYVGDSPEGPFVFYDVAVKGDIDMKEESSLHNSAIDRVNSSKVYAPHNPTIHKVDSLYALFYIVNDGIEEMPSNQHICLAVSKSLYGPWEKIGDSGKILSPPENSDYWNYEAENGVNNPAFLQNPDGGYYLYFKSSSSEMRTMGLAIAENLKGPYVQMPYQVTGNKQVVEDGYSFMYNGKYALFTTDNYGIIEKGGGILWTSEDGLKFNEYEKGMHRITNYTNIDSLKRTVHYGSADSPYSKFERPQVLLIEEQPKYLYVPSGHNIYGGEGTISYVLKFKE